MDSHRRCRYRTRGRGGWDGPGRRVPQPPHHEFRLCVGEVEDIVDAVLYLAEANFTTGVVLPVDGGVSAGGN